jgi:hypothetical protein
LPYVLIEPAFFLIGCQAIVALSLALHPAPPLRG